jgi:hypothetical protein
MGNLQVFTAGNIDGNTLALVTVLRLDHHRQANFFRCSPCIIFVLYRAAEWYRHTGCIE